MRITKIERWSDLQMAMTAKGYEYAGSKSDTTRTKAAWCKNIDRFDFRNDFSCNWKWQTSLKYSILIVIKYSNGFQSYCFYTNSKAIYTAFRYSAKQSGFKYVSEELYSSSIDVTFKKESKTLLENLVFCENTDGTYDIIYKKFDKY